MSDLDPEEKIVAKRFNELFEGVEPAKAKEMMEELIDEYTWAVFGFGVISEARKVKAFGGSVTIQPIAGKGILLSPNGFDVTSVTQHPKGGQQVFMKEVTNKEKEKRKY